MDDQAIEPSEIIIDRGRTPKEESGTPNPYFRFVARFFDYSLFFFSLWGLRTLCGDRLSLGQFNYSIPIEFFLWIPIEALFLKTWGTTPGKFFLKIELRQGRRRRLEYFTALKRSVNVWFRGLGMWIPFINFFCLLVAYQRLKLLKKTSWDREENIVVTHLPIEQWRVVIASLVAFGGLLSYYLQKS